MSQESKYYQFTVINNVLVGGNTISVPVSIIYAMGLEEQFTSDSFDKIHKAGMEKALASTPNSLAVNSYIIHSMFLGKRTHKSVFPPKLAVAEEVDDETSTNQE